MTFFYHQIGFQRSDTCSEEEDGGRRGLQESSVLTEEGFLGFSENTREKIVLGLGGTDIRLQDCLSSKMWKRKDFSKQTCEPSHCGDKEQKSLHTNMKAILQNTAKSSSSIDCIEL